MNSKGQTFLPDYIGSIVVFGIILTIFLTSWNSVVSDQTEFEDAEVMRQNARQTATFLVSTPGYPDSWEEEGVEVQIPGFAEPDHVLQEKKLEEFGNLSYAEQKRLLQAANFYLAIRNQTGIIEIEGDKLEYGNSYSSAETVIPVSRTVQLNLSGNLKTAEMKYIVWR